MKPRVLFVSRRVELPLSPSLLRKWDAIGAELEETLRRIARA